MTYELADFIQGLGGLGLFLLGMTLLTDGLHASAGDSIRQALMKFTRTPTSGAITGACSTAILQSSSATTVAAVGFVGAGLISFSASLGIIFGANIGTTITGWLVALVGFKLKIGTYAYLIVLAGVICRLFGNRKVKAVGTALAGFGLIFVGIQLLQLSMTDLHRVFSFENFPADSWLSRIQLMMFGILFTLVTQSSSAGVATTLTALFSGLIQFEQAAALVIGMDIGTTVTAALATIGANTEARRTGLSHIIYNCFTGVGALLLITPYCWMVERLWSGALVNNAEIALVAFHTLFNILFVLLILPLTDQFAALIKKIVPRSDSHYTDALDASLLSQPLLAINGVQSAVQQQLIALLNHLVALLNSSGSNTLDPIEIANDPEFFDPDGTLKYIAQRSDLAELQLSLNQTHHYLDRIHGSPHQGALWHRLLALIHVLDHMQRLHERCEEEEDRSQALSQTPLFNPVRVRLLVTLVNSLHNIEHNRWVTNRKIFAQTSKDIHHQLQDFRQAIAHQVATGELSIPESTLQLEGLRWLIRVNLHLARISKHLSDVMTLTGR